MTDIVLGGQAVDLVDLARILDWAERQAEEQGR